MKNLFRIMSFFKELRWRVLAVILVGTASIIIFAFMPQFLRNAFNDLERWVDLDNTQVNSVPMFSVIKHLIIFGFLMLFNALFDIFCTFAIVKYENKILTGKFVEIKKKLDVVPYSFLEKFTMGDLSRRIATHTDHIIKNFLNTVYTIARTIVFFVTTSIMMFTINWILAIVVVLSVPLCIVVARFVSKRTQKYITRFATASAATYTHIDQRFSMHGFYNTHGIEEKPGEFDKVNNDHAKGMIGETTALAFNGVYISFIKDYFMPLVVTLLFCVLYVTKAIPTEFGVLPAFLMYSNRFLDRAVIVTTATNLLQGISAKAPRVFEILDAQGDVTEKEHIHITKIKNEIAFKNVTLMDREEKLLDRISFKIPHGSSVAFVGPTGCGKARVVELLTKLAIPTEGQITVDGINLDEIRSHSYYKCVGLALEHPFLFRGTVAENLLYGIRRELPENVIAITEKLGSHGFIDSLENGYETQLAEDAPNLSNSQKQAIGVARLVLQTPDVAIFDESLSAADTVTEKAVFEAIMKAQKLPTTVFVTHRLASVEKCDIIYYMEKGKIVEKGTHAELMARKKKYYKAYIGD